MSPSKAPAWIRCFEGVLDPRLDRTRRHKLIDIIVIAVVGTLCGADDFVAMAAFARAQEAWFRKYLELPNGVPSHDTINRVFRLLSPESLGEAVRVFLAEVFTVEGVKHVAIDGKTSRSARDARSPSPLHMVSAYATAEGVVLGQLATDVKSNEITAIPKLLQLLDLKGSTVTIDAMGCQLEIAQAIVTRKGDYILAVKDNQPKLRAEIEDAAEAAQHSGELTGWSETSDDDHEHGRVTCRMALATTDLSRMPITSSWPGAQSVIVVASERTVMGTTSVERRLYISSKKATAKTLARIVRAHWAIENSLHWVLDVAFNDDRSRARRGNAAANLVIIRQVTAGLLKNSAGVKAGIKTRRLVASANDDYRARVLAGISGI